MSDHSAQAQAPAENPAHAGAHAHGDYWHHVRPYILVGAALFVLTGVTVWLSYVNFDDWIGGHGNNIKIGLAVATFKVCLVGAWFMHLKMEKGTIWRPLCFTFFFCLGLFLLCLLAFTDPIPFTSHVTH